MSFTQRFSAGAEIKPANLVALRDLASQLPLHKQKRILNDLAGTHTSAVRGRGIDFSEVREYQPGDDIRSMDWRVTARTGDPHIKLFREERERPVLVVCDLRAGMHFGTRRALKSVLAADISALIAWAAMANGDRIGGLIFNDQHEVDLRPKTGRKQVLSLLHNMADVERSQPADSHQRMQQICRHIRRVARPGSAIYFVSDWAGFDAECERQLFSVTRHCDLIAVQLHDPIEAELPPPGLYNLTDQRQKLALDTHSQTVREAHQQAFAQQQQQIRQHMLRLKVPLIRIATNDDPLTSLRTGLGLTQQASGRSL
ncbi:DUF58 domain-containing protein [Bacterioplanoides sp.]|uniref:DUF58 domain-containing protein n=1 Tax=Bacterioplanoides sp. TaxID=2066072 RepID=UPI003B5AC923